MDKRRSLYLVIAVLVLFFVFIAGGRILSGNQKTNSPLIPSVKKIEAPKAKAKQNIDRDFNFPLKDEKGTEVGKFKYQIVSAQLQDEILVKGQRAKSVVGKTFLIFDIKITNSLEKGITVNSRDYVRLSVDGGQENIAPDVHNDPTKVQAISTKSTRIGFPINENYKKLVIKIGEINGQKEEITISPK